ncbi:type I restriction-modification system subunit M [Thomasclavelia spiroformis]|uniref:type I restriction-modification system subunit M n=1 Tax=Thomasclavelia spiroformis TaxID=29348 RepID=UPI00241D8A5F|nr:type I restriction-modification system subunit M [Thomasclavelia spiroformis]MBS6115077.1 type I restriction-modification system subunit M [Thomasclavelia spiroformis]
MNKQQLANKIWESANKMRSKIEANEYKDYILGFIFYKYLSDQEIKFLKENDFDDGDISNLDENDQETVDYIRQNIGYFISYNNLFSTWILMGKDFDVSNVRDALSAFERLIWPSHKKVFENIFHTLDTGLSKLGDSSGTQTKAISGLLQLIKDIPMDGKQDYDVLGFIYEYLISMFAANAGKKAGEFYTPHEVSFLMSEIIANHLKNKKEIKIYDPTSGSGSLLINIGNSVAKYMEDDNNIKYYAQELKENTYNLTRMNLVMRGIRPDNIVTRNGDTLEEDWPYFDENDPIHTYSPLYVDAVVSNPPYSQAWDSSNKENDPRYSRFGLAPKSKADYAFLLHDLFHIKPDGIMAIVLPHGVLFRGGEEGEIRKNLIENNHIDTIIGLPANIFFGTGIPTIIMILKQKRANDDIFVIDASKGFIKEGKNNKLRASDIKKIVDTVIERKNIDKFSKVVSRKEIRSNGYNLNIPRYVDSSEEPETWDVYASMFGGIPLNEIDKLKNYWQVFPNLKISLFNKKDGPYVEITNKNIKDTIKNNEEIQNFKRNFAEQLKNYTDYLKSELLKNIKNITISKEENILSEKLFECLETIPLVDKYEAYQILDDEWQKIAIDLEIIQTEGYDAIRKVDPNMVFKKKNGKEQEVQEGWLGRVIPFELVQKNILIGETKSLKEKEVRLLEISSQYEEIIDSLTEDEKENGVLNDTNDAFVSKEVTKKLKELKKEKDVEVLIFIEKLKKYDELNKEEKSLKKRIKEDSENLQLLTKTTIESLSDNDIYLLLEKKWIQKITDSLNKLPDNIINKLIDTIQAILKKYETTYFDIDSEIKETENKLALMIDELEGDEFDLKGLSEFKSLLLGKVYE